MSDAAPTPKPPRLFVGAWPPEQVGIRLSRIVGELRGTHEGVRWAPREHYHVTLAFLGQVRAERDDLVEALNGVELEPAVAEVGPEVRMLGRGVVCVPVAGLEEMASAVREAMFPFADEPETRPFVGHITLVRLPGRRRSRRRRTGLGFVREWVGTPVSTQWTVDYVDLVQSLPGPEGSTYHHVYGRKA